MVAPCFYRHHYFFQSAIARALAQAIDSAFHLACSANLHTGQRVGHGHTQIVVAMHAPNRFIAVGHALAQVFDEIAVQLGNSVAHGVGHVDSGGPFSNHCFNHAAQEIRITAVAIFRAEFDVLHQVAGKTHTAPCLFQHLFRAHAQFFLHVQGTGSNEGMDTCAVGIFERLGSAGNVAIIGTRQRAHGGVFNGAGNRLHRLKITIRGCSKAGFDHIHLQALQLAGDTQFFIAGHGCARGLLAIAQGGVENNEFVCHRELLGGGWVSPQLEK